MNLYAEYPHPMASLPIPQIFIENAPEEVNTNDNGSEIGKEENERKEEEEDEEEEDEEEEMSSTPKKSNFLSNLKKLGRPRARSIDIGRTISPLITGLVQKNDDFLKIEEEDLASRLKKKKSKNKLKKKLQNFIKKGSSSSSGVSSPISANKPRNRGYSIDFSNSPTKLSSLSPFLAEAMAAASPEDTKSKMSRRGSLAEPPEGTFEHKVKADESLASIAAKHKSTPGELKLINRLMNDMVFIEQVLHIPVEPMSNNRRRFKSECVSMDEPENPSKLGKVTEESHCHHDDSNKLKVIDLNDDGGFMEGWNDRRGSDSSDKPLEGKVGRRRSLGAIFGFGMKVNDPRDKSLFDDTTETKKEKNKNKSSKIQELKSSINSNKNKLQRSISVPKPKSNVFSATLHYITGAEDVAGLLAITVTEVRFEPFKNTNHLSPEGTKGLNAIYDLIKHRMSLANLLYSACLMNECPLRMNAEEKDLNYDQEAALNKKTKYLCLKLRKKKVSKNTQTPFLEALIKNVLPGPRFYEHYFTISTEIIQEFETFMRYYYDDNYNRQEDEDVDFAPSLPNVIDIKSKRETFRRTLSLAELCNLALPEMSQESQVFTDGHIRVFREFLPAKVDGRPWKLGYSSWKHGFSLNTMYRCLAKEDTDSVALLIIQDTSHQVFGALITGGGVKRSEVFYGTGESFLFTFYNFFQKFSWTGTNDSVASGSADMFAVGASDSKFGLCVDNDLERGFTNRCKTFDNETLTNDTSFHIHTIEVWLFPMELE